MNLPTHNASDICGGVWWCLSCRAPASIEDPGESNPLCGNCGKRKCEWHSLHDGPARLAPPPSPVSEQVPIDAQPMLSVKRLPRAERPSLSQMAFEGYWLCRACEMITKRDEQECCVLCGSSHVEFQPPTLPSN